MYVLALAMSFADGRWCCLLPNESLDYPVLLGAYGLLTQFTIDVHLAFGPWW